MKYSQKEQALIDILNPACITRDNEKDNPIAIFWREEPKLNPHGNYYGGGELAGIDLPLFKRIRPGRCVKVGAEG